MHVCALGVVGNMIEFKSNTEFVSSKANVLFGKMFKCAAGWASMQCLQVRGGSVCLTNVGIDLAVMLQEKERELQPGKTLQ